MIDREILILLDVDRYRQKLYIDIKKDRKRSGYIEKSRQYQREVETSREKQSKIDRLADIDRIR